MQSHFCYSWLPNTRSVSIFWALVSLLASSAAFALKGGASTPVGSYQSIVRMQFKAKQQQEVCSGVRIGPRHVLTAAHCVGDIGWTGWYCFNDLGHTFKTRRNGTTHAALPIRGIYIHPNVSKTGVTVRGNPFRSLIDLAVIEFEQTLPTSIATATLNTTGLAYGTTVTIGGFGLTSIDGTFPQNLQQASVNARKISNKKFALEASSAKDIFLLGGDSGGPVFQANQVVGINSYIEPARIERRLVGQREINTITSYNSYATTLAGQRTWIQQTLRGQVTHDCAP